MNWYENRKSEIILNFFLKFPEEESEEEDEDGDDDGRTDEDDEDCEEEEGTKTQFSYDFEAITTKNWWWYLKIFRKWYCSCTAKC